MRKLFIVICILLLSGCSHLSDTRFLMCDADFNIIKDKSIPIIGIGIVANLAASYAAHQCVTFKIVIPFAMSNDKILNSLKRNKHSTNLHCKEYTNTTFIIPMANNSQYFDNKYNYYQLEKL